ncbi:MAG: hypothetical protein RIF33_21120 [Cyclobacteriaceae bacterium]
MFAEIVADYKNLQNNLDKLITASGYELSDIAMQLGMEPAAFEDKIENNEFRVDEVEKLLDVIKADELEDKVLLESSLENEKDTETIALHG